MKIHPTSLTMALLCSAALIPAAHAQDEQQAANEGPCAELAQLTDEHEDRFRTDWLDQANATANRGNAEQCTPYVEQAQRVLDNEGEEGADSARIVVDQPQANVAVQQDAPNISVQQPQPQVSINQGEPEIIVRQAQPTITVDMPQPTISIDQPEPEIIVRMPEPGVSVTTPQPEVEVSQDQPEVHVSQAEPTIEIEEQEQAQVSVEREQPVVQQQQAQGEAQVSVEREQPTVTYERAEPNVQFNSEGEPEVQFSQSGEPQVRFEDGAQASSAGDTDADQRQARAASEEGVEQESARSDAVSDEQTGSVSPEQAASAEQRADALRTDGNQPATGEPVAVDVSELLGKDIINTRDQELGTVERVVTDGERNFVVLSQGGFLGMGEDEVALPLNRMAVSADDDHLIMRGMTEDEIEAMPQFNEQAVQDVRRDAQIELGSL